MVLLPWLIEELQGMLLKLHIEKTQNYFQKLLNMVLEVIGIHYYMNDNIIGILILW